MVNNFDDIVFENREKNYGAYVLRKKYHLHLIIGFLTILFFSGIICIAAFYDLNRNTNNIVYISNSSILEDGIYIDLEQLNVNQIKKLSIPAKKNYVNTNNIEIVDSLKNKVETESQFNEKNSNADSIGNSDEYSSGVVGGTGIYDYYVVEKIPEFECGEPCLFSYIVKNVVIPRNYVKNCEQGTVYVNFIVNKNGNIEDVKIFKGVNAVLDSAAVEVLRNMPKWKPASQYGLNVAVAMMIPINFNFTD